ncbi:hypothetical protein [Thermomonospora amylolytica]|uniref:hypothetical protein n=1 Tax=Thermomonospora amylolytica TaxID=1411117 RepID=UPI000E6C9870|nr:hypothetical protein [Thermomonospora amylolytica]
MLRRTVRAAAAAALVTGATVATAGVTWAATPPGDNGTVKIHDSVTGEELRRNEPHVCTFYLDGFGFDAVQKVTWWIEPWAPTRPAKPAEAGKVLDGALTLDAEGHGRSADLALPDGHYKLFWTFEGKKGAPKHKVFWVDCTPGKPGSPGTPGDPKPGTPGTKPTVTPPPGTGPAPTPGPGGSVSPSTPAGSPAPSKSPGTGGDGGDGEDTTGTNAGGGLPFTGAPAMAMAATGAALLLGGGAALWLARRKKATES